MVVNKGRDFSTARPDITHQCLLMLFDSPLNRLVYQYYYYYFYLL